MAESDSFEYDVFVSYRHGQPDEGWVRQELVPALERASLRVCLDAAEFRAGRHVLLEMERVERSRHVLAVITPRYFEGSGLAKLEALNAAARDPAGESAGTLIPFVVHAATLPGWMKYLIRVDWTAPARRAEEWAFLLKAVGAPVPDAPPPAAPPFAAQNGSYELLALEGVAEVEKVFPADGKPLEGQVFAVELLQQPIILNKLDDGTIRVVIGRDKVTLGVYTTEGKQRLSEQLFAGEEQLEKALQTDRTLDRFLRGEVAFSTYKQQLTDIPLRWGSGGVLPVVQWKKRAWTPFFFRDIEPFGWNIPLGATKASDDLNDPWTFLLREFLEEVLVLDGPPTGAGVGSKVFTFDRLLSEKEASQAAMFAQEHIQQRLEKDGIVINGNPGNTDKSRTIPVDLVNTGTEIRIGLKGQYTETRNVLVCINVLELGIEVVKVMEFKLHDADYLIDGEIAQLPSGPELVRMPVALISHDYLRRAFSPGKELTYVGGMRPSVQAPDLPGREIHVFPFDAVRRRMIATGAEDGTEWEKQRYEEWMERFGSHFFDDDGNPSTERPSRLFTPSAAKLLSYYFAYLAKRR